ncbi:MAG: MFS transporter [Chlamydiales bacterium]
MNIGTTLEWYELSLYAYWAPTISKIFFDNDSPATNLLNVFLFLGLGYLIRPLGGIFFGRLGDKIGRRKALIWSILTMTIPTMLIGFLPSYSSVGIFAPILLCINRLLQSFPAGGELPGSFCYLYESAHASNRKYLTSWGFMGNQMGIMLAMVECLVFEKFFSAEDLFTWGWRLSFLLGSLIGFYGFYLRHTLKETPVWAHLEKTHKIVNSPISNVLLTYKWKIVKGICYSAIPSVSFGALAYFFPIYLGNLLGTSYSMNLVILIIVLVLITIPLPFFGKLADKYDYKKILINCTSLIIVLMISLHFFRLDYVISLAICVFLAISFSCLYAILPFILTDLFPTPLRFSGIGLTFNIADSLEGLTPATALYLLHVTESQTSYFWILLICSFISLGSYLMIQNHRHITTEE